MEENVENVVEETTQQPVESAEETKFDSAGDDSILKVDLSKPPPTKTKEDAVQKQSAKVDDDCQKAKGNGGWRSICPLRHKDGLHEQQRYRSNQTGERATDKRPARRIATYRAPDRRVALHRCGQELNLPTPCTLHSGSTHLRGLGPERSPAPCLPAETRG